MVLAPQELTAEVAAGAGQETPMKTMLLVLVTVFASCAALIAQEQTQSDSRPVKAGDQQAQKSSAKSSSTPELRDAITTTSDNPSLLEDAGPANIEDATRRAAHDLATSGQSASLAKKNAPAKDAKAGEKASPGAPSAVGEFHEAPEGTSRGSANSKVQEGRSPGKRIHGDIYGAGSRIGRAGSGSVGATSRSGKTSVYVQSDQVSTTQPQ
jgi:hypothetical protein